VLHIIGHPLLKIIQRIELLDRPISELDFVQRLPVEFVLGGTVIYIWALIASPFHWFNIFSSFALTALFGILYGAQYFTTKRPTKETIMNIWRELPRFSQIALGIFGLSVILRVIPQGGFVIGSVPDTALHTIFVYSILHNAGIPQSALPGLVVQVPQGFQILTAYFTMISSIPPEMLLFYEIAYFNAIVVIAAYTFSSILISKEYALIVEILMAGISYYPIAITWGAQWIPWGLAIFFVFFTFAIPRFIKNEPFQGKRLAGLIIPGIFLGYLASTYTPLYVLCIISLIALIIIAGKQMLARASWLAFMILVSLPLLAIWIYRNFVTIPSYTASSYNLQQEYANANSSAYNAAFQFLPYRQFTSLSGISRAIYNWAFWQSQNFWPGALALFTGLIVLGTAFLVLVIISRDRTLLPSNFHKYLAAIIVTIFIWGLDSPLGLFFFPAGALGILSSELNKLSVISGTILLPFLASIPIYLILVLADEKKILRGIPRKKITNYLIVALIMVLLILSPFEIIWLHGNYGVYDITTSSDYQLLQWMKTGIPSNATVLVNPYDSGQYVPTVANKTAVDITTTGITFLNPTYERASRLLSENILNSTTISLIRSLNVSYVYVGSYAVQSAWNPQLFINNRLDFLVVKNFSSSYLFKVIIPPPNATTTLFGPVYNDGFVGISDNRTLLDFNDMSIVNLDTGGYKYFEIVANATKSSNSNGTKIQSEIISHLYPPKSVSVIYQNSTFVKVSLVGQNGTALISARPVLNQYINCSVVYTGANMSKLAFGIFPITTILESNLNMTVGHQTIWSDPGNVPLLGFSLGDISYVSLNPENGLQLSVANQTIFLSAPRIDNSMSFSITTSPLPTGSFLSFSP
jgi:hypothetical protein